MASIKINLTEDCSISEIDAFLEMVEEYAGLVHDYEVSPNDD